MKRKKIALIKAGMAAAAAIAGAVLLLFGSVELYRAGGSLIRMLSRNSEKYETAVVPADQTEEEERQDSSQAEEEQRQVSYQTDDWNLVLVNPWNEIPDG